MENKPVVCRYCGKSLNGQVRYHRGGEIFCNDQEATLFQYADFYVLPPMPKVDGIPFQHPEPLKRLEGL